MVQKCVPTGKCHRHQWGYIGVTAHSLRWILVVRHQNAFIVMNRTLFLMRPPLVICCLRALLG